MALKILVPVKRTIDAYVTVRVKADQSGIVTDNVKTSMNPFCEIAVEQAVRLKEQGIAAETMAVTIGQDVSQDVLRTALAVGIDKAALIKSEDVVEPLGVAKLLKEIVVREKIDLVIMGKQAIDGDNNQTGQMLSALLGWPQATFVSKMAVEGQHVMLTREIDGGLQDLKLTLPAIITVDLRLNDPRYASLPNIMKARKKEIEMIESSSFGFDLTPRVLVLKVEEPPKRQSGIRVKDVDELVEKLKTEAKVI